MRFLGIYATVLLFTAVGCSASREFHVRGQLGRRHWVVTTCESRESYRVILASTQAFHFYNRERQLGLSDSDPVIADFDAFTIDPKFPWDSHETIGARSQIELERGICSHEDIP